MPWTTGDVDGFRKGLDQDGKKTWVKIANSSLASCQKTGKKSIKDCEASAIKIANAHFMKKEESTVDNARKKTLESGNIYIQEHYKDIEECYPEDEMSYSYPRYYFSGSGLILEIGNENVPYFEKSLVVNGLVIPQQTIGRGLPFYEESASKIKVTNFFEYLEPEDIKYFIEEIYIVLEKGGEFIFRVPHTPSKNSFGNINYKSYMNELSFSPYTDEEMAIKYKTFINFSVKKLEIVKEKNDFTYVDGVFVKNESIFLKLMK